MGLLGLLMAHYRSLQGILSHLLSQLIIHVYPVSDSQSCWSLKKQISIEAMILKYFPSKLMKLAASATEMLPTKIPQDPLFGGPSHEFGQDPESTQPIPSGSNYPNMKVGPKYHTNDGFWSLHYHIWVRGPSVPASSNCPLEMLRIASNRDQKALSRGNPFPPILNPPPPPNNKTSLLLHIGTLLGGFKIGGLGGFSIRGKGLHGGL